MPNMNTWPRLGENPNPANDTGPHWQRKRVSVDEALAAFRQFAESLGLDMPAEIIADGEIHRVDTRGKHGDGDGSYLLHNDGRLIAGGAQNWQTGAWQNWPADPGRALTPQESDAIRRQQDADKVKRDAARQAKRESAAERADSMWENGRTDDVDGHPYLVRKGIKANGARRQHRSSNLLIPVHSADGELVNLQLIDANGEKRFLNGGLKQGCSFEIGKVIASDSFPRLFTEGHATGASLHQATNYPVVVAFDAGNVIEVAQAYRARYPDAEFVICADDDWRTDGNPGVAAARAAAAAVGGRVAIPEFDPNNRPDGATYYNDVAALWGDAEVRRQVEVALAAKPEGGAEGEPKSKAKKRPTENMLGTCLLIGSDVEVAGRVIADLRASHGEVVFDDGDTYHYDGMRWAALSHEELRLAVHQYDGATYLTPEGKLQAVRLSRGRVDSVLSEMRAMLTQRDFLAEAQTGINCKTGFITFGKVGEPDAELPSLASHNPDHRCRHVLPGKWQPDMSDELPSDSLLHKLLDGVFKGDTDATEKVKLVRQIAGCAALGYATRLLRPKAIICHGESAENGKSQVLDVLRGVLPKSAIASVPVTKFSDQSFLVRLAGKTLNATDELKGTAAIEGDTFKACVTGETVTARDLYRSAIEFRPVALHIFATNALPSFRGGFDRGVLRRLLVLPFNRVIPVDERIENIGQRIIEEESDLLLAFAVAGASDLIRERNFTVPSTSEGALKRWVRMADPVMGWAAARVKLEPPLPGQIGIKGADAHVKFEAWAVAAGYRREHIPALNGFLQRLTSIPGIASKHTRTGNSLVGFSIRDDDRDDEET